MAAFRRFSPDLQTLIVKKLVSTTIAVDPAQAMSSMGPPAAPELQNRRPRVQQSGKPGAPLLQRFARRVGEAHLNARPQR